ncbi:ATP-binding cassette sub-family D member 4 [Dichotomocladium elegans]|nr:ATP-binding cassette sub-family D member 4 [Dichotomocladium elegans]
MVHSRSSLISESESMIELESQHPGHKNASYSFDRVFLRRLERLIFVLFPSSRDDRCWSLSPKIRENSLFWLYIMFIALSCGTEIVYYYVGLLPSRFYGILSSSDFPAFVRFLFPCLLLVFGAAAGKSLLSYLGGLFALRIRKLLTQHLHQRYIRPKVMYFLTTYYSHLDNPDQRITQDTDKFAESLRQIVENLIIAPILVIYYTWQCWAVSGALGPIMIYLYFVIGSVISRLLIRRIVNTVFYKEHAEGNFRFLHVRLRQFVESIAFSNGEPGENRHATRSLDELLDYQRRIVNKELPLNLANESFAYFGSILSYLIVAMPIYAGVFADKDPAELSEIISKNSFFSLYLIFKFSTIIEQSKKLSELAGYTARIGELLEAIDDIEDDLISETQQPQSDASTSDGSILFEDVRLVSPNGKTLLNRFSFRIGPNDCVAFVGRNGSGKSSLLRALCGLWKCASGRILLPKGLTKKDIMILPQTPYLIHGSLREQIMYPHITSATPVSDHQIRALLEQVQLSHLEMHIHSFDTVYGEEWQKMLSPGEQQRLMFARILHHKPRFADEATSAMDTAAEAHLYKLLMNMDIAIISVSHHPELMGYHKKIVTLDGNGEYTIDDNRRL